MRDDGLALLRWSRHWPMLRMVVLAKGADGRGGALLVRWSRGCFAMWRRMKLSGGTAAVRTRGACEQVTHSWLGGRAAAASVKLLCACEAAQAEPCLLMMLMLLLLLCGCRVGSGLVAGPQTGPKLE